MCSCPHASTPQMFPFATIRFFMSYSLHIFNFLHVQAAAHMDYPGLLPTGPLLTPLRQWWPAPPVSPADPTPLCPLLVREDLAATAAPCRRLVIPAPRAVTQSTTMTTSRFVAAMPSRLYPSGFPISSFFHLSLDVTSHLCEAACKACLSYSFICATAY